MRCGYVALLGRPNVGKSSLCNRLVGEEVAIVTAKPQTTRQRIAGIYSQDDGQIIFLDTPGVHQTRSKINEAMVEWAHAAAQDADLCCLLIGDQGVGRVEKDVWAGLNKDRACVVINKIDQRPPEEHLELCAAVKQLIGDETPLFAVSARNGFACDELRDFVISQMPEGPALFPQDEYTDVSVRFLTSEIIRKAVFEAVRDEVPYSTAVEIESFAEGESLTKIHAVIVVERESQKGIVVGKGGAMIKRIGAAARPEIEALVDGKVYLELFVKVAPGWTESDYHLKSFGLKVPKS